MDAPPAQHTALALALAALAPACNGDAGAAVAWPAGTVLAVENEPILAGEVDEWLDTIALVEPAVSKPALRRFALTNIVLFRTVARILDPQRFEAVRADAERARARLVAGEDAGPDAPPVERVTASWTGPDALGLDVWGRALKLPAGEWSPVFESIGAFVLFRVTAKPDEPLGGGTRIALERLVFPYLDPEAPRDLIESAVDQMVLTVVDPAWSELVPEHYKYRMKPQ